MEFFQAVILGIVQGFTEFLPISSSGHLVLFQHAFGVEDGGKTFDVWLHIGTLIPVFIVFRKDILHILKKPFQKLTLLIITATIPAVVVAMAFKSAIEGLFEAKVILLAIGFTITGVTLLLADGVKRTGGAKDEHAMTSGNALIVGCAQAVAIAPGISRSGSTVTAALFCGLEREAAARFSFLMSIPAICGAAALELISLIRRGGEAAGEAVTEAAGAAVTGAAAPVAAIPAQYAVIGALAAALAGYLSISFMLDLIKKAKLKYFSFYVFALAAFIIVDTFILKGAVFSGHK